MSDGFTDHLRELAVRSNDGYLCGPALQAADRIEALTEERDALAEKLEKVVVALREYLSPTAEPEDDGIPLLRATLAQITGGKTDG